MIKRTKLSEEIIAPQPFQRTYYFVSDANLIASEDTPAGKPGQVLGKA